MTRPKLPHYVTVEGGRITGFECPWLYGECHTYPSCDCEIWRGNHSADYGPGHGIEHHERCWIQGWFDEHYWEFGTVYVGDDMDELRDESGFLPEGLNRSGPIKIYFCDEYIEWEFK